MGTRNIKRQIAKARMKIVGFEKINKNMSVKNSGGLPNWKTALLDKKAERGQLANGIKSRRKLKKVTA